MAADAAIKTPKAPEWANEHTDAKVQELSALAMKLGGQHVTTFWWEDCGQPVLTLSLVTDGQSYEASHRFDTSDIDVFDKVIELLEGRIRRHFQGHAKGVA